MQFLTLASADGSWSVSPVLLALSWRQRWAGVHTGHDRVLLPTAAVHGRGLLEPLHVIGIDNAGSAVTVRRLDPGSFLRVSGASWILEQPIGDPVPASGMALSIYPRGYAREIDSVWDADRQSW